MAAVAPPCAPLHTSTTFRRDLLAKYARPHAPKYSNDPNATARYPTFAKGLNDAFETSATAPVLASIQEVPPHSARSKLAATLPAMVTPQDVPAIKSPPAQPEIKVAGVIIPPKPVPPGEEECCMSGCVHCVYTIYADDVEEYTSALQEAKTALEAKGTPVAQWPDVVRALSEDGTTGQEAGEMEKKQVERAVDPSLAAFLALENKLKKK